MISVEDALAIITAHHKAAQTERVVLADCLGRRLAEDIKAKLTQPPLDASAMDGYAVRLEDILQAGATLTVIGEAPAGTPFNGRVGTGEAVRIFTGGAVPTGADTVIIQENVEANGTTITVTEPQKTSRHIRRAGLDFKVGQTLLSSGQTLTPAEIGVAAAAGHAALPVQTQLTVAILSGGDELIDVGTTPQTGQIINSNPQALAALIKNWGHIPHILPSAIDSLESLTERIAMASNADVIVPVGGASIGDHDYMRAAFQEAGLEMLFEKIAVRPGKPTWFGTLCNQVVLGLPGNPASAMVCTHIFLKALLTAEPLQALNAKLSENIAANGPRETYQRSQIKLSSDGQLSVTPLPLQDSGLMTPFLIANGLLRLAPHSQEKQAGELVEVIPIKPLF